MSLFFVATLGKEIDLSPPYKKVISNSFKKQTKQRPKYRTHLVFFSCFKASAEKGRDNVFGAIQTSSASPPAVFRNCCCPHHPGFVYLEVNRCKNSIVKLLSPIDSSQIFVQFTFKNFLCLSSDSVAGQCPCNFKLN